MYRSPRGALGAGRERHAPVCRSLTTPCDDIASDSAPILYTVYAFDNAPLRSSLSHGLGVQRSAAPRRIL